VHGINSVKGWFEVMKMSVCYWEYVGQVIYTLLRNWTCITRYQLFSVCLF